jgi:hypothetical protein
MQSETIGIILTNLIVIIGAVWRMSASLSKIETQLSHLNEKMGLHQTNINQRVIALEERVTYLERSLRSSGS